MTTSRVRVLSLVVAAALCSAVAPAGRDALLGSARADDNPPADAGKDGAKDAGKDAGKDGAKPDGSGNGGAGVKVDATPVPRIERARQLVKELETTIAVLKASKNADAETLKALERALEEAKKLAVPITAAEMTDEEKKQVGEELAKGADPRDPPAAKDPPGNEWAKQQLETAFKDTNLTEEEQIAASKIITDWWGKWQKAWGARDSKAMSDLKSERDDSLTKVLGRKKAMKVINNLNSMGPGRGR